MIDTNPDELFNLAERYWTRLKEFVDNHATVSDYVLERAQKEYDAAGKNGDFNELYKKRFTGFVMATHALIDERLHHASCSRCFFVVPTEEQTNNDIAKCVPLEKRLESVWSFVDDIPIKYINSINDIVAILVFKEEWKVDSYTFEHIAKRYIGTAQDGKAFYTRKRMTDINYRAYGDTNVRLMATKHFPKGPFTYAQNIFVAGEEAVDERRNGTFLTEKNLEAFVSVQKKVMDTKYKGIQHAEE